MNLFSDAQILDVNLSTGQIERRTLAADIYRQYPGGSALGVYLILQEMDPKIDPLDPNALMVWSVSPLTGFAFSGSSRMNIAAKSPLTGGMGDSQVGGNIGAALKSSGYDAVIFRGKSAKPTYLHIDGEAVELRSAEAIWGKGADEAEDGIFADLGTDKLEISLIGQAGENAVKFAAVIHQCSRANGRNGLGAVMGSKNLKAVAIAKAKPRTAYNKEAMTALAKEGKVRLEGECEILNAIAVHGSNADLDLFNSFGFHAYKNWQLTYQDPEHAKKITGTTISETILKKRDTCYACVVRCKRVVEIEEAGVKPRFGGPEYETASSFGSFCGVDNLNHVCQANQLCNQLGMDTISAGGTVAFVMECFEKGLLTKEDTGGLEFAFGDGSIYTTILPMIAKREGFGDMMAEGGGRMAKLIAGAEDLFMGVKNQEFPAHMAQQKAALGLIYAVNPFGADHQSSDHDTSLGAPWDSMPSQRLAQLGINYTYEDPITCIDDTKAHFALTTQQYVSILDTLCLCQFPWALTWGIYGPSDIINFAKYGLGWELTMYELMQVGARRINMMRWFNAQAGFTSKEDILPKRSFEEVTTGPEKGRQLSEEDFYRVRQTYYRLAGWDQEGRPQPETLKNLGLDWLN